MIDLRNYHIIAIVENLEQEEKEIKLPKTEESLKHSLLANKVVNDESMLGHENFNAKINSVVRLKRIENIEIRRPTNIYYLNMYLNILKEKGVKLTKEHKVISTDILKQEIADLIGAGTILSYDEVKDVLEEKETVREVPDQKQKPMFKIKQLQKRHHERKEG